MGSGGGEGGGTARDKAVQQLLGEAYPIKEEEAEGGEARPSCELTVGGQLPKKAQEATCT